ncbi:molybdopterin-synthase adenylyltransferase [Cohnella xylanilytica]|uniref:ThiF family adenylyltransferase n=1 Tax=Cohnella xylanilytica TaxID=557555 RepID=UPI001B0419FB|nr:ThiF family adenylyltransferase [Cohnella xylanilytica]GIO13936.1 molybdopterin-synthase adenylyltransferase [Cohnella xylanilytica]
MPETAERETEAAEERYSRQIRFAPIGAEGQRRLRESSVLIVGVGALGSSLAMQMARAGVGTLKLADRDYVEPSNLQRQSLFDEEDARSALPKAVAAAARLRRINGAVRVEPYVTEVNSRTADALLEGVGLVLDGTDNARTRIALSDACFAKGIPLLYGGVTGSEATGAALVPGETACLRCLIGGEEAAEPERTCETAGVIYPAVEFAASLQAAEALKWLTGNRSALRRTWLTADVWDFRVREAGLPGGRRECPYCGEGALRAPSGVGACRSQEPRIEPGAETGCGGDDPGYERDGRGPAGDEPGFAEDGPGAPMTTALCGRDTIQVTTGWELSLRQGEERLRARGCELTASNPYLVRATVPEGERLVLFGDGRVLVQGAADAGRAVGLCRKYLMDRAETERGNGRSEKSDEH